MPAYILGITKRGIKGITNRGRFQGLHIGAQRDYKKGELKGFQIGAKRLQIGEREIANWGRDFKSGKGLQIGTEQLALMSVYFIKVTVIYGCVTRNI